LVRAYVWYTPFLEAEDIPEVAGQRERLSKNMTPDQIAEAERLVAECKPNPAECDIGAQAEN
jgi:hypothetical protein